jgi:hypothetical protein
MNLRRLAPEQLSSISKPSSGISFTSFSFLQLALAVTSLPSSMKSLQYCPQLSLHLFLRDLPSQRVYFYPHDFLSMGQEQLLRKVLLAKLRRSVFNDLKSRLLTETLVLLSLTKRPRLNKIIGDNKFVGKPHYRIFKFRSLFMHSSLSHCTAYD